jgi:hypothetical protein
MTGSLGAGAQRQSWLAERYATAAPSCRFSVPRRWIADYVRLRFRAPLPAG